MGAARCITTSKMAALVRINNGLNSEGYCMYVSSFMEAEWCSEFLYFATDCPDLDEYLSIKIVTSKEDWSKEIEDRRSK